MQNLTHASKVRPYARKLRLNYSPFEVAAAFHKEDYFVFLDSSRVDTNQGRYSVLAWEPEVVLRSKGNKVDVRAGGEWQRSVENPFEALRRLLQRRQPEWQLPNGFRFGGGAIGYLGYDLFPFIESYETLNAVDDLSLPDCCLGFYETVLVFDHLENEWIVSGISPSLSGVDCDRRLEQRLAQIEQAITPRLQIKAAPDSSLKSESNPSESNMTESQYFAAVREALDHIYAGDIYQVNLSQRFCHQLNSSPFELFSSLRMSNPSFYGAYLNCADHFIISSSPELFLSSANNYIETRPIKGTRPRGRTRVEDERLEAELRNSYKDAAELAMIVDLKRNDLGRVCEYGTVEVVQHRYLERLPTLFHTISIVRGRLRENVDAVDILRATFPGGSITGCPKIRAIKIIDDLEPTRRHVYTGAIGFIGFDGNMTLNIAIRTLIAVGNRVYYQVGGGIVADSVPEKEYTETLDKAFALRRAIDSAARAVMRPPDSQTS